MTPGLAERPPDPGDDPHIHDQVLLEYAHADRLRASLLAAFFFLAAALFAVRWGLGAIGLAPVRTLEPDRLLVGAAGGLILGTLELVIRSRAMLARTVRGRALVWYGSTILEVGTITVGWLTFAGPHPQPNIFFPGTVGFAALIVLSALRLDWGITLFTGATAAIAAAAIQVSLRPATPASPLLPVLFWSVMSLVVIGALTALVAEQARRRTLHAIGAVVARERLEKELMRVAEAERQRIGRDLHDGLGGRLSALVLLTQGLARRAEGGQAVAGDELRELAGLVAEGVDEARGLARGLNPAPLQAGLVPALRGLAERTVSAGTPCSFVFEGEDLPADGETTVHLYHVAQEAVTNAVRHGSPSRVDVRLTVRAGTIALDVRDDGDGIPEPPTEGLGLRTMRQRAALLDAVLRIRRGPTGGTVVSCVMRRDPNGGPSTSAWSLDG